MFRKLTAFFVSFSLLFCVACSQSNPTDSNLTTVPAGEPTTQVLIETTQVPTEITEVPTEQEETQAFIPCPIDSENPVVEAYTNKLTTGNPAYTYHCSIPQIQSESSYVKAINQELTDYYNTHLRDDDAWQGGNVSYDYYVNGDILTLVVYFYDTEQPLDDEADYRHMIHNIRMSDGSEVTAAEILQIAGVTTEDFRTRAKQIIANYILTRADVRIWQEILAQPELRGDDGAFAKFAESISEENLYLFAPFLAQDGALYFMGRVHYFAGGFDYGTPLFSYFDDFEVSPYYEDILALI